MAVMGPLQVLVVNFDEANFSGEIDAELSWKKNAIHPRLRGK